MRENLICWKIFIWTQNRSNCKKDIWKTLNVWIFFNVFDSFESLCSGKKCGIKIGFFQLSAEIIAAMEKVDHFVGKNQCNHACEMTSACSLKMRQVSSSLSNLKVFPILRGNGSGRRKNGNSDVILNGCPSSPIHTTL